MENKTVISFSDVFLENNGLIYKYIFLRTGYQKEIAEDLSQEVFFKALKNFEKYNNDKASIKTWLFRIARNVVIDFYRTRKENHIDIEKVEDLIIQEELNKDLTYFILRKIKLLKELEQEVVIYKFIYELSDKEISAIINKHNSATRVLIFRTINKLKELVNKND